MVDVWCGVIKLVTQLSGTLESDWLIAAFGGQIFATAFMFFCIMLWTLSQSYLYTAMENVFSYKVIAPCWGLFFDNDIFTSKNT